ncbi:DUF4283 domain-containing protein [Cephalotus follicularis]|uniref:DUF4283 domain-containing protein n=1 Tax=Cephalotus follicularis TaxID=3775 RepID=A0A1Q3CMB1_CEPFO|nr:DUF4283 domain-containing protein [Cephalotus follicularis]
MASPPVTGGEASNPPCTDPPQPPSNAPSSSTAPTPQPKLSYKSALGRPTSAPLIPLSQLPDVPKISINPKSPSSFNGKPLVNLSPTEVKLASEFHSLSLIAKFSLLRPPVDLFEHHVNSTWGLQQPATVGLIDPKHFLIHLQSEDDFARAWSRETKIFDNRRFLLLRWTPDFTKRKDSSFSATWLCLPGLPLPCQNPAILEVIGNSFGRFLRLDERTKKMKHPLAPRLCVEMNLAFMLPDVVVIAIGSEEPLHQKIEYDLRIGFCNFCHLQGHQEPNCRKKQAQATLFQAVPSTISHQGNASNLTSNAAVVNAVLPAGVHRPRDGNPNKAPVAEPSVLNAHPPAACVNASTSLSIQPCSQLPLDSHLSSQVTPPALPSDDPQASQPALSPHTTPPNPPSSLIATALPQADPSAHSLDSGSDHQPLALSQSPSQCSTPVPSQVSGSETLPIVIHNQFALLMDDSEPSTELVLGAPSLPLTLKAPPNPQSFVPPTMPSDSQPLLPPPVSQGLDYAPPVIACSRAAQAFLASPAYQTLRTLPCPLASPPLILSSQPDTSVLAIPPPPSASQRICTLNTIPPLSSSFDNELPLSASPPPISYAPKRMPASNSPPQTKSKRLPKGSLGAPPQGAPPPSYS